MLDSARITSVAPYHRSIEPRRQESGEPAAGMTACLVVQAHPPSRDAPRDPECERNELHGRCGASYSGVRFGAIMLVAACGSSNSDPARAIENKPPPSAEQKPPPAAEQVPPATAGNAAPSAPPPLAKLRLDWSNVVTKSDCFYFSGPEGRDDHLAGDVTVDRNGSDVRLRIGDEIFTGTFRDNELAVERHSVHDYGGPWNVTETIRGRYREGLMRARYHYEECEMNQACPGRCTIDANLLFVR